MPINENKPSRIITWAEILQPIRKHHEKHGGPVTSGHIFNEIRMVEKYLGDNFDQIDEIIAEAVSIVLPQFKFYDLSDEEGIITTVWCHPEQLEEKMNNWRASGYSVNETGKLHYRYRKKREKQ